MMRSISIPTVLDNVQIKVDKLERLLNWSRLVWAGLRDEHLTLIA